MDDRTPSPRPTATLRPPSPRGRFASILLPEVAVRGDLNGGLRVVGPLDDPYRGLCKARLYRTAFSVGESLPDGRFDTLWVWPLEEDRVGDDEAVSPYVEDLS